jgi:hypothetical protein
MFDNDTKLLAEAYTETMTQTIKRKYHYIDKGRKGYYCKLCIQFKKNVKSPNGDEYYCQALKIYVSADGLCSQYKKSHENPSKPINNKKPNTPHSAPASNKSPATQGNDMHSDPQVSQTPV